MIMFVPRRDRKLSARIFGRLKVNIGGTGRLAGLSKVNRNL